MNDPPATDPPTLLFGQTPWDHLDRAGLDREVRRLYDALVSCHGVLVLARGSARDGFWGAGGSGRRALTHAELALAAARTTPAGPVSSDDTYRAFFRYADDLLFSPHGPGWTVCPAGHMTTTKEPGEPYPDPLPPCRICALTGRPDVARRPLTWDDLKPVTREGEPPPENQS